MSRKFKSSTQEQDEAFFGSSSSSPSPSSSSIHQDEEYARKLQEQYIQSEKQRTRNHQKRQEEQERQDLKFALQLQRQGSSRSGAGGGIAHTNGGSIHATSSSSNSLTNRKKRQEEEDAKLARAMQEAEGGIPEPRAILNPYDIPNSDANRNDGSRDQPLRRKNNSRLTGIPDHHTINALVPRCASCKKIVQFPIFALGNLYHRECFRCKGCGEVISPNESFAVVSSPGANGGERHPYHKNCYAQIFGMRCSVSGEIIQGDSNGRISYIKHPFFEEVACSKYAKHRRCASCHRFEPLATEKRFVDLADDERCVCYSCCRTVIVDSNDAKPLWNRVMQFFENYLKLPVFVGMSDIPVLIVPHETLNSQMQNSNSNHRGSAQIMTRGLCLSEHQIGWNVRLPSMRYDRNLGSMLPSDAESRGHTYFQIPSASKANPQTSVTAILCLNGLPADLTASILAHEATHAWIKMHPNFDPVRPIPPQVEEGCCQLIAMLFLIDGLEKASSHSDGEGPTDEKLRQYFKFCIETDTSEVYGEGYRKAAMAYAEIGIEALLSHVVNYREFPQI